MPKQSWKDTTTVLSHLLQANLTWEFELRWMQYWFKHASLSCQNFNMLFANEQRLYAGRHKLVSRAKRRIWKGNSYIHMWMLQVHKQFRKIPLLFPCMFTMRKSRHISRFVDIHGRRLTRVSKWSCTWNLESISCIPNGIDSTWLSDLAVDHDLVYVEMRQWLTILIGSQYSSILIITFWSLIFQECYLWLVQQ